MPTESTVLEEKECLRRHSRKRKSIWKPEIRAVSEFRTLTPRGAATSKHMYPFPRDTRAQHIFRILLARSLFFLSSFLYFFAPKPGKWASTHISTLSTLTPQGSVASSRLLCMICEMVSLSERISARFFVPNTFRNVVAARRRVEWLEK